MPRLIVTIETDTGETIGDAARKLRTLADRMEFAPEWFRPGADPALLNAANPDAGSARVI